MLVKLTEIDRPLGQFHQHIREAFLGKQDEKLFLANMVLGKRRTDLANREQIRQIFNKF